MTVSIAFAPMSMWDEIDEVLSQSRSIAVLGASIYDWKPAFYVPEYMAESGFRVVPVNPVYVGHTLWNEPFRSLLSEVDGPVDVVDVFRRSSEVGAHLPDILALDPLPRMVWLQQGVRNGELAAELESRGVRVIQDACLMVVHRTLQPR